MPRTRVLLVNSVNPSMGLETRFPSLSFGYLAATARRDLAGESPEFKVVDHDVAGTMREFRPHLVGISSTSQNFNHAVEYASLAASLGVPAMIGGAHISAIPSSLPRTAIGVLGEGEETFVELLQAAVSGPLTPEVLERVPGVTFWEDGVLRQTTHRAPATDLDCLPMPARDLFDIKPHTYMFTSRGCPYRCTFCFSTRFWGKVRFFSPEYVVEEIATLVRDHKVETITFYDDLFVANMRRVEEIARLLEQRRLLGRVQFTCYVRANLVQPQLAALLKRLGVVSVAMGLESGDDETLDFLKGGVTVEQNRKAIACLKGEGIATSGTFVIGSPRESREQVLRTYDFIRQSQLDLFDVFLLTPLPGTPIWKTAKERGLVSDDMDWSRLEINPYRSLEKAIVLSEVLSPREIRALYRQFRRLRTRRIARSVFTHPLKRHFPAMAMKLAWGFVRSKLPPVLRA
jgi:radical SAM superfamily enzyme YgiQ (UPF0313 family)